MGERIEGSSELHAGNGVGVLTAPRRGFTTVEIVVAIVVLSIGLLGLVSSAAMVTRMIGQGRRYSQTAALANQELEVLRAGGCAAMAPGTDATGRTIRSWTVTPINAGVGRRIDLTIVAPTPSGHHVDRFTLTVACP